MLKFQKVGVALGAGLMALSVSGVAVAQDAADPMYVGQEQLETDEQPQGFSGQLGVEASFNLVSNQNVIGQNEGTSFLLGGAVNGGLDYFRGKHQWRNTLAYNTSWARTPVLREFVKNNDKMELESIYNYLLNDWIGPYGRGSVETSAFATELVTEEATGYLITRPDGSVDGEVTDRLRTADPISPLNLFQSVGVALEPVRQEAVRATLRVGFGAREALTEGVLVVQDDETTGDVELVELENAYQAGAEAFLGLEGKFPEQRIDYRVGATALVPFINNDQEDRSPFDLARIGVTGKVRVAIVDWMGLTYSLMVLSDPQLLDATQVQNSLLLTFNYTLIDTEK
ncbi:hypothetical protein DL240_00790 [Lujinxingia litoralis]|uniref:DUF3078 domain-containing protein n=1 Tax=Lujinxingia litoralis TaxID=2211119 RepID=A0A328CD32_9DELT|nr:DUF3078 domain-containing protein [Lujinxingia litoralis]RAL24779.1 hypothetical protein DL240_00790 [Lujinxingia litoralis]